MLNIQATEFREESGESGRDEKEEEKGFRFCQVRRYIRV